MSNSLRRTAPELLAAPVARPAPAETPDRTFGQNLRYLRRKFDVPQTLLAEEVGIPTFWIKTWENRGGRPDEERVEQIAAYFQVSKDWLLASHELGAATPLQKNPLDWKPRGATRKVTCLRCDRMFLSEGPANRICDKCKKNGPRPEGLDTRFQIHTLRWGTRT